MYIVQGIITNYPFDNTKTKCYTILDTKDGIAEDVNVALLDRIDLVFGEQISISDGIDYGNLYYNRNYSVVGTGNLTNNFMVCDVSKTWNIAKQLDNVIIDDSFYFNCNNSKSISLKKVNTTSDTKIRIELEKIEGFGDVSKAHIYIDNYLCCSHIYSSSDLELGICEIEQNKFGVNITYRIHFAIIGSRDRVMYDDLYFDLDINKEVMWFKGRTPELPLNTINNIKKKIGGILCQPEQY